MTRRQLLLSLPAISASRLAAGTPKATPEVYPGTVYRPYFRVLPDFIADLAGRAYRMRNRQIALLTTPDAIARRQHWVRETFWKLTGGLPERTPLRLRTLGGFERSEYRVEKLLYESRPNFHIPANLYIPKLHQPPFPGVLFQMGHSANGKAYEPYQRCCQGLVKLGYLVLAFDPMGQGERIYYPDASGIRTRLASSDDEHSQAGRQMLLIGDSATRMQAWDSIRSLDVLASHPMVDAKRIGATGQSGGGTTSMFLAAIDDRVAAIAVCSGNTENVACADFLPPGSTDDAEQDFPGSGPLGFDRWDLLYPFAPKPLMVSVSDADFFGTYSPRYIANGWEEFRKLRGVYSALGKGGQIAWVSTPLPHSLAYDSRVRVYSWFARWLKGETKEIVEESATAPEPDETLWVASSGNVVRTFSGETPFTLAKAGLPSRREPSDLRNLLGCDATHNASARLMKAVPSAACDIEILEISSASRVFLPAWLFRPKPGAPVKNLLVLLEPSGRSGHHWVESALYQNLAADGQIVCVPDLRGVGNLAPEISGGAPSYTAHHGREESWAWSSLIFGKPLVGQRVTDVLAILAALRAYPPAANRPIVLAAQGKMTVPAQFAAAIDTHLAALYLAGGLISFRNVVETENYTHPFANFVPGLLRHVDLPDLPAPSRVVLAGAVDAAGQEAPLERVRAVYPNAKVSSGARWDAASLTLV